MYLALEVMQNNTIDLAILDVMMPRLDGFNLLRKIRQTSNIPVIFLTARGDEMDKILGLGIGADDYLVKPFSMAELFARVSAQLRRNLEYSSLKQQAISRLEFGSLCLDKDACSVYKEDEPVELNAKEYKLLKYLIGMYVHLAKREEKDMLIEFGDEYREYMKITKMFIPFIV